jgi:hypothetical protein
MPIRQRGPSWQVDVRLPDGRRYRKTVNTEEEAKALEASLSTNPLQRRAFKQALQQSRGAMKDAAPPSETPSKSVSADEPQPTSIQVTSPTSPLQFPITPPVTDTSFRLGSGGYLTKQDERTFAAEFHALQARNREKS